VSATSRSPLATALGWFSLGLGTPQVATPERMNELIGVDDSPRSRLLQRAVGVRELLAAIGLLGPGRKAGWLWARVAGDVMDLALLGSALRDRRNDQRRVSATAANVLAVTALDLTAAVRASGRSTPKGPSMKSRAAITIKQPADTVYAYWQDFANLPTFMTHLESVEVTGNGRSHWTASAPAGQTVEWDAEVTEDKPGERIAWRSLEGATVPNSGQVAFTAAPGGRGTEVRVELEYELPGGVLGKAAAKLFGEDPQQQVDDDLRRFKQVLETGEVVRSEGSPEGLKAQRQAKQRPAQPAS
jgi:uncharacterized membrane protein